MEIGSRILCSSRKGTVRYIGSVDGHEGTWVGVEWDDIDGGKHNGTVKEKFYFKTRFEKNGSFVRPQTVSLGHNLLDSIKERYTSVFEEKSESFSSKVVELVGMENTSKKQSDIFSLVNIVLDDQTVSSPPPRDTPLFKLCRELNLYGNLLHKWNDVRTILNFFPYLTELVLRKNRMDAMESPEESTWTVSPLLTNIVLSDCYLSAATICNVLKCLNTITHLHSLRNDITNIVFPHCVAERLVYLDLEGNSLDCFQNLGGIFPNLSKLSLTDCNINKISLPGDCRFPRLSTLSIKGNNIGDWDSINELQKLPELMTLYIDTKLFKAAEGIAVHEVIAAKLSTLADLNRFDVSPVERRSSEVRFISKYFDLPEPSKSQHKYDVDRLIKIHGPPAKEGPKKCLNVLKIVIMYLDKKMEKNLPLTITVQKLIDLLSRQLSLDPLNTQLVLDKNGYIVELDNPMRPFGFYSPESSDILRVKNI